MKIRDSGMPDEVMWTSFFDPVDILTKLGLPDAGVHHAEPVIVDLGCGYGTFSIPAAQMTPGKVIAFDIEEDMTAVCRHKASHLGLQNIKVIQRDFLFQGTGLVENSVDFCMMFNILHTAHPDRLLAEAYRLLRNGSKAAVIHWNYDPATPRGPAMDIRRTRL